MADNPGGQNLADSAGNPRGLWLLVEGIHMEIVVVSETRIYMEIDGKFKIGVEMRGKFPITCKHFNSPKIDIKSSLGYFHTTVGPFQCHYIAIWILRETRVKFPHGNIPGDSRGKGGGDILVENSPLISPKFPRWTYEEFSTGMIPWNSPVNPHGNCGWLACWDISASCCLTQERQSMLVFLGYEL